MAATAARLTRQRAEVAPSSDLDEAASAPSPGPERTRTGKYDVALTEIVAERPGITVATAAAQIGVHPTALYPVIRRLEANGAIVKLGRELQPVVAAGREQLWCEDGHTWTRVTVRGRKPKRCPDHAGSRR